MEKKELMLTLWNYCNNRCTFCYNNNHYEFPLDIQAHLIDCLNLLKSDKINQFTCIRLVGGELFYGIIDKLNIQKQFVDILNQLYYLLENNKISEINFVTNLMYTNRKDLCMTLELFKNKNISLTTSYDWIGRFSSKTEKLWWDNLMFLKNNYPELIVDISINITQPLITEISKQWLDNFKEKIGSYTINFNELFTGIDKLSKRESSFSELFPKRKDFLVFIRNLIDWGYINTIKDNKETELIHYIFDGNTGKIEYRNTNKVALTEKHNEDGYIDSDASMQEDIKRIINASW